MLKVTTVGSHNHVDSQALGEVDHRLVMCSCGSTSRVTCSLSVASGFEASAGVYGTFSALPL